MPEILLPEPGPHMLAKLASPARHKIVCAGRRWRKSTLGMLAAICGHGPLDTRGYPLLIGALQGGNIWWVTESFPIAESVWLAVSGVLRPAAKHISEKHYRVTMPNGGALTIKSAANPGSLKGDTRGLDGVVLDEAAYHDPRVWQRNIRPALSDREAWSLWASTPNGYNHFKEMYDIAKADATGEWEAWNEPSSANPFWKPSELEKARRENVPETEIQQEFFAKFELSGAAKTYFEYEAETHVRPSAYDPLQTVDLCVSFGVAPAAWLATQGAHGAERVIGEIRPEGATGIRDFAAEFRRMFPRHRDGSKVRLFGEVAKGAANSDFEAIRAELPRLQSCWRHKPFEEKDRINATNAILRNRHGEASGFIDPSCVRLIQDLESTRNAEASYRVDRRDHGFYAAAWGAKLAWLYPAFHETRRARDEESRWPEKTPDQRRAWRNVEKAKRNGTLVVPPNCEDCGEANSKLSGAHIHKGYLPENDLKVRFLCRRCHTIFDLSDPKNVPPPTARH